MNCRALTVATLLAVAGSAQAYDFKPAQTLGSQADYRAFSQDVSAVMAYKPMVPAQTLGVLGFDLGVSVHATDVANSKLLEQAASSANVPSMIPTVAVRAQKGLPFDVDVGASYELLPGAGVSAWGGELRWAALAGGLVQPAVAVRAYASRVSGIQDMNLSSAGLDVSISKGFALIKPYAGVGVMRSKSSTSGNQFNAEHYNQTRTFVGANLNLVLMDLAFEVDRIGENTAYSIKAGFRF
jgi:hypothetical protein